ncbi:MAG: CDP-diacylglycerol--glycerol-3-phosphate 3-phosphatidyltransferase [Candidatus Aureabacteria bacterium]|nr:CDP-diacylglycerol--glycerol-3-phosphate 3-phosphatidyltransferase [Candidatus Auribacterota bacterium]
MNVPNKLTLIRIFIAFVFMGVLVSGIPLKGVLATLLFAAGCVTDYLDGKIARDRNIVTDFGKLMDPLADKIMISAALITFVQLKDTHVPAWMVVVIIGREFFVTGLRLLAASKGRVIPAGRGGKNKIISQIVAISVILLFLSAKEILTTFFKWDTRVDYYFGFISYILIFIAMVLSVLSGFFYFKKNKNLFIHE